MTRAPTPAPPADAAATDDARYASVDGLVAALTEEECIFQHAGTGETHVMTMDVLAAMDSCRRFRTLDEHVVAVADKLPALKDKRQAIAQVLGFLIQRGLMVSDREQLEQVGALKPRRLPPPPALAIRTCDRPARLAGLLDSIADYEQRYGRGLDYVVIDDSRHPDSVRANRDAVARLAAGGIEAHHLDRAWRTRLAKHCNRELGRERETAHLLGVARDDVFTGGAASNASLLLSAGSRLLLLDDDFRLLARRRPGARAGLGLREPLHMPISFEPGFNALEAALEPYDGDPLAAHIDICGQPAGRLFAPEFGLGVTRDAWRDLSFDEARAVVECDVIKTTAGGVWGDTRMDTTLWYYLLPGRYSRGLWADEVRYRALLNRPTMAHGFDQVQLARLSSFTPVAVDNTGLCPCMPPTGRGEDYAFAAWMRYLYPRSLTAHLPLMLRHERPDEDGGESPHAHPYVPWFSRFAGEYALSHLEDCQAERAGDRIGTLVALYRDLAAAPVARRVRVLREFLAYMRAQIVKQMQQALTSLENPPEYWLADAREWIGEHGKALTESGPPRLRDWPPELDRTECAAALAEDLEQLAAALERWSELWRRCRGRYRELLAL